MELKWLLFIITHGAGKATRIFLTLLGNWKCGGTYKVFKNCAEQKQVKLVE